MTSIILKKYVLLLFVLFLFQQGFAQQKFTYAGPQIYQIGEAIPPLNPVLTGTGTSANTIYSEVKHFGGNGIKRVANGTLKLASFLKPGVMYADEQNIYLADAEGKMIRKIDAAGNVSTLAGSSTTSGYLNGTGTAARFSDIKGITARNGIVYVAEAGNHTIRAISATGVVTTLAGNGQAGMVNAKGAAARFNRPHSLVIDASGNIYVTDSNNGYIRKITADGTVSTYAGNGQFEDTYGPALNSGAGGMGLVIDKDGNLFFISGDKIKKISAQGVISFVAGSSYGANVDGKGEDAIFYSPEYLSIDKQGNLYVAETNDIRKVNPDGTVTTLAGNQLYLSVYGVGKLASFSGTGGGLAVDSTGALIVADYGAGLLKKVDLYGWSVSPELPLGLAIDNTGAIRGTPRRTTAATNYTITALTSGGTETAVVKITTTRIATAPVLTYKNPKTYSIGTAIEPLSPVSSGGTIPQALYGTVTDYIGNGSASGFGGIGTNANIRTPRGLAFDGSNLYTASAGAIFVINRDQIATAVAGGTQYVGLVNGRRLEVQFNQPSGVAVDAGGNLYVADRLNHAIRKIDPTGLVSTLAGTVTSGAANGQGSAAAFNYPASVACDASGNVFVADEGNHLIRKITPSGLVTTFAGSTQGFKEGTGAAAQFNKPTGLAFDAGGNLYVADQDNYRIRKILPSGEVSTVAGNGQWDVVDGPALSASFRKPVNVAPDDTGNLYVTDNDSLVRKITPTGQVSAFATVPVIVFRGTGGFPPTDVSLHGILYDPAGFLYVTDILSHSIRKIGTTGYSIHPALPKGLTLEETGRITGTPTVASPPTVYQITAYNASGSSTAGVTIEVSMKPVISQFTPANAAKGQNVFIEGLNFTGATAVSFGGMPAQSFEVSGDNSISATVGEGKSGDVIVTTAYGTDTLAGFTYDGGILVPAITSFTPATTTYFHGVTITGTNFTGATAVSFGGVPASSFRVVSPTTIFAVLGNGASGDVVVVTPEGTATLSGFTYIPTPEITSFTPMNGKKGDVITIKGSGFTGINKVEFGSLNAQSFTVESDNTILATVGDGETGKIYITNGIASVTTGTFIYNIPAPVITAGGPVTVTTGGQVVLSATGGTGQYQWYKDGTVIAGATKTSFTAKESGSYTFKLTIGGSDALSNAITVKVIFTLPASNFSVSSASATCKGSKNGSILITAAKILNYTARVSGGTLINQPFTFANEVNITDLAAGIYKICITAGGEPDYQQCFDVNISEPKDLSVYANVNKESNVLTLGLSGGRNYEVKLNDVAYKTSNSSISIQLKEGSNKLSVSTDLPCQGIHEEVINFTGNHAPYPNPFLDLLHVNIGESVVKSARITIHNVANGQRVFLKSYSNRSGTLPLDVSGLASGMYVVSLTLDGLEHVYKIVKR